MDIIKKAEILTYCTASQRGIKNNVYLSAVAVFNDAYYVPPQEIYLTIKDIEILYEMVQEKSKE